MSADDQPDKSQAGKRRSGEEDKLPSIPCLFLKCYEYDTDKLLILFHGNGEDIGTLYDMAHHLRLSLKVHVLVPEYPGYGIYRYTTVRKNLI